MIDQQEVAAVPAQAPEPFDAYRTLQLRPAAPHDLVEQAYWVLVSRARAGGSNAARLGRLNDAYAMLINPERRAAYDLEHGLTKARDRHKLQMPKRPMFSRGPKHTTNLTHYELLDIRDDASPEIVDTAYVFRKTVLRGSDPLSVFERTLIEHAYTELHDPERRAAYDAKHLRTPEMGDSRPRLSEPSAAPAAAMGDSRPRLSESPSDAAAMGDSRPRLSESPSDDAAMGDSRPRLSESAALPRLLGKLSGMMHLDAATKGDAKSHRALRDAARDSVVEAENRRLADLGILGDRPAPVDGAGDLMEGARAQFRFIGGPQAGEAIPLSDNSIILGASDAADVVLANPDGMIGAGHVRVWHRDGGYILHQLDSFSTTYVNGERLDLRLAILEPGDELRIGPHTLVFDYVRAPEPAAAD